MMGYVV